MDAEQIQALIDAGFTNANNSSSAVLIFMGAFMGLVTVIISLSLVFVVIRLLAVQTLFINQMTVRAVMANEQIRSSTDTQTQAIQSQSAAIEAVNKTGMATGAVVAGMDGRIHLVLNLAKELGVDVKDIAKHVVQPTAATKDKVEDIAEKPAAEPKAAAAIPAVAEVTNAPVSTEPASDVLTLPITVTLTQPEPPAVPT